MKDITLRISALLAGVSLAAGLAVSATAQTAPAPDMPRPGIAGGHGQAALIASHDLNGDGQVTREEYDQVRAQRFEGADVGNKGYLTEEEYVAEFEARLKQQYFDQNREPDEFYEQGIKQAHVRFAILDRDRNSQLSREEYDASGDQAFKRNDTNGDGVVNADDPAPERRPRNDDDSDSNSDGTTGNSSN